MEARLTDMDQCFLKEVGVGFPAEGHKTRLAGFVESNV